MCHGCGSGGGLRRPYFRKRANANKTLMRKGRAAPAKATGQPTAQAKVSRTLRKVARKTNDKKIKAVVAKLQRMLH
jgi:hypothetical protein